MRPRTFALFPLVVSALCAAVAARMAWREPRYLVPFLLIALVTLLPPLLARRRMRRLLISGDVDRVLGSWEGSLDRLMYPETMGPLMKATAYAAYGWLEAARRTLSRAVKGPAWEAAIEQRLFIETLLDVFEGDRSAAVEKAQTLERLPLPSTGPFARARIARLRRGIAAFARAFAHQSEPKDFDVLRAAGATSPLVHWAMRYAAAVAAVDQGRPREVAALLQGAPTWPKESVFRAFHDELLDHAR